jgi:hypothetical protein
MEMHDGFSFHHHQATKYVVLLSTIQMYLGICVRYAALLSNFTQIWSFSTDFHKSSKDPISMKVCPMGAILIHADRQTGRQTWQS